MTVGEAIAYLDMCGKMIDADTAKSRGASHDPYERGLEAIGVALEALEKRVPAQPNHIIHNIDRKTYIGGQCVVMPDEIEIYACPNCNREVKYGEYFCKYCGQAINFEEVEE